MGTSEVDDATSTSDSGEGAGGSASAERRPIRAPSALPARPKKRGRRASPEHWTKVTVVLFDRHVVFLDRLGADIRAATGAAISRAHVIRALVDALSESDIDLTGSRSERELAALIATRLGHRRSAAP